MLTAHELFGVRPQPMPSTGVAAPTSHMGTDDLAVGWRQYVDPANPLMIFGVILLVTVGAAGVAGSVRLGPAKISASAGKS